MTELPAEPPPLYGLDIETDTSTNGLDPRVAPVIAVAVSTTAADHVLTGPERQILAELDELLAGLPAGVIVTWNGSAFDLPFLADRAAASGVALGLVLRPDPRAIRRASLPGHLGCYSASWYGHTHLDAYRLWRPVRLALGVSASLKSVARFLDLPVEDTDRARIHELTPAELERYVASDARLARLLGARAWPRAGFALDPAAPLRQA